MCCKIFGLECLFVFLNFLSQVYVNNKQLLIIPIIFILRAMKHVIFRIDSYSNCFLLNS